MPIVLKTQTLQTPPRGFVGITNIVQYSINEVIEELNLDYTKFEASVTVFCPHSTAAITLGENADHDVQDDFMLALDRAFPHAGDYKHDNSPAHMKTSVIGSSEALLVHQGQLMLGHMQAVYLVEFDGPRTRTIHIQISY